MRLVGQSAIEYLMTYGWMLLVVAIVGGAIFSVVGGQTVQSVTGFTGDDVQVENFGVNQYGELQMVLRNSAADEVQVNKVKISDGDKEAVVEQSNLAIGVTGQDTVRAPVAEQSGSIGANEVEIEIDYNIGDLEGLTVSGEITGSLELIDNFSNVEPENTEVVHQDLEGEGTEEDPYRIYSVQHLQSIKEDLDGHYVVRNDIRTDTKTWNEGAGFEPIGNSAERFTGTLDGQGHTISGLAIDNQGDFNLGLYTGLFGYTQGSEIKDLKLANINMSSDEYYLGSLIGRASGDTQINRVELERATIENEDDNRNIGGIAGRIDDNTIIENVNVTQLDLEGHYAGGIAGRSVGSSEIRNAKVADSHMVFQLSRSGGITGQANIIRDSVVKDSTLQSTSNRVGGITGRGSPTIINTGIQNVETDFTNRYTAGIVGQGSDGTHLENVYVEDSSIGINRRGGGVIGRSFGDVTIQNPRVINVDIIAGSGNQGGIIGRSFGKPVIENALVQNLTLDGTRTGGLIGDARENTTITNSAVINADIQGGSAQAGGLIGRIVNADEISNSYVVDGEIAASTAAGAIGELHENSETEITNIFAANQPQNEAGFVGIAEGQNILQNVYWDKETSETEQDGSTETEGLTTDQLTGENVIQNLGFSTDIWENTENYPELQWRD